MTEDGEVWVYHKVLKIIKAIVKGSTIVKITKQH